MLGIKSGTSRLKTQAPASTQKKVQQKEPYTQINFAIEFEIQNINKTKQKRNECNAKSSERCAVVRLRGRGWKHLKRVKVTQNIESQSADLAHNTHSRLPIVADPCSRQCGVMPRNALLFYIRDVFILSWI